MVIKETIMHYIDVYDGCEKRVIQKTISDHRWEYRKIPEAEQDVKANIHWLVENGYIKAVPYSEMNDRHKTFYLSDYCTIYQIIRRFNESEYLH